jgi:hypothetical protein
LFQSNRFDVCCFLQGPKAKVDPNSEGILYKLFKVLYVPLLMKSVVRAVVMVVFFGWVCASVAVIPHIEIGLDQELSMSEDSYVYKYFKVTVNLQFIHEKSQFTQKLVPLLQAKIFHVHCACA